jgi:IMP dehydrogenase/GMP reductase
MQHRELESMDGTMTGNGIRHIASNPQPSTLDVSDEEKFGRQGITFDDVLLVPAYSEVLPTPEYISTSTYFTPTIPLNIPVVSAAMDTVTEGRMAIAMAREGGIGVIHRNMPIMDQAREVDKVKRSEAGMIVEPITLGPGPTVAGCDRAYGALPYIRRADNRGRATGRHPDQPRYTLCRSLRL